MRQSSGANHISVSNRKFIIGIESAYSDKASITYSVPQGSILDPLLFLIYIKEIPQVSDSESLLYINDICLFLRI